MRSLVGMDEDPTVKPQVEALRKGRVEGVLQRTFGRAENPGGLLHNQLAVIMPSQTGWCQWHENGQWGAVAVLSGGALRTRPPGGRAAGSACRPLRMITWIDGRIRFLRIFLSPPGNRASRSALTGHILA